MRYLCLLLCCMFSIGMCADQPKADTVDLPTVQVQPDTVTIARDKDTPGVVTVFVMLKDTTNDSHIQQNIDALKGAIKLLEQRIDVCKKGLKEEKQNKPKEKSQIEIIPDHEEVNVTLPIGTQGQVLLADTPASTTELKWATKETSKPPFTAGDVHYLKDGTAYMVVPAGTDLNDPKYWMQGNKPYCEACWQTVECKSCKRSK